MNKFKPHYLKHVKRTIQKISLLILSIALIMTITSCGTTYKGRGPCGSLWDKDVMKKGNAERVETLIACGANVNQHNAAGEMPLHRAADLGGAGDVARGSVDANKGLIGDLRIVELLLANGADPRAVDRNHVTPLHYANQAKIAELLIGRGADVNALTIPGQTPLHYIAERGYGVQGSLAAVKTAEVLIKRGANVNAVAKDGSTPLYKAVLNDKIEMARVLLRHGANPNAVSKKLKSPPSPLAVAVSIGGYGNAAMVELLLVHGADANIVGTAGTAPLHYACQGKIAALLVNHGANVNTLGTADVTPLYAASYRGNKDVVQLLLSRKADPNKRNNKGSAPLHVAANRGYRDVVETLIANGADYNAVDASGWTALHHAAYHRRSGTIEVLLAHQADVNAMTNLGSTPLHVAVQYGKEPCTLEEKSDAIKVLLAHGANIEQRNGDGQTPLLIASRRCDVSDVKLLLAGGADVNVVRTEWKSRPSAGDGCKEVGALLLNQTAR